MDTGLKISLFGHVVFITALMITGPLFDGESEESLKVTSVSLISGDELAALDATGIDAVVEEPEIEPEPEPEPLPEPEPEIETPNQSDLGLADEVEQSGQLSPDLPEEQTEIPPRQSDKIAPIAAEEAPEVAPTEQPDVETEPEPEPEPEPIIEDTPPTPVDDDPAPILDLPEATTEISPILADEDTPSAVKTARPKPRPADLTELEPEPTPETEPDPTPDPTPEPNPEPQRLGSSLSQAERNAVILSIEKCWNPPAGVENAEDLRVVIGVDMNRDGSLASQPVLISPSGAISNLHQRAFDAARRAINRCAPFNDLPADKYETWKRIEMTFDPKELVLR